MKHITLNKKLLFLLSSVLFAIAIFTCVLIDCIINKYVTWSMYVIASCALAWLMLLPLVIMKKQYISVYLAFFTLLIIPFLFIIEYASPASDWAVTIAAPVSLISLAYMWTAYILITKIKMRILLKVVILLMLAAPLTYFINMWSGSDNLSSIINATAFVLAAIITLCVGFFKKSKI